MVVNVVEMSSNGSFTFVCNVSSSTNLTRWTYISGPTRISLMSYQNVQCTVSPSDSYLTDISLYSYTCNSTVHEVTITHPIDSSYIINHILACRDAVQPDGIGSNWIIKILEGACSYCEPTMSFNVQDITEGDNVTFICRVSSDVAFVNWNMFGSNTAAMGVLKGQCVTSPSGATFLDDTNRYDYTCNKTVYQVTILNGNRSEHNDMYMCTPPTQLEGTGLNWIIKVKAPVTSVTMAPSDYLVNVKEGTSVVFTCTTSTARPAASVYWFRHTNGTYTDYARITENITTTTDYNDLSVTTSILRFVPTRLDNNTNIFCKAKNSVNTAQAKPDKKRLLNVLFKADDPYINPGNEHRVIEDTLSTLSCTVKGGNPTPTLSWSCNIFSPTHQSTINSNGNVTKTLTWTPSRTHEGKCTCTSTQTGFQDTTADVFLVVLYPPSKPIFIVYGNSVNGNISFIEGNSRVVNCTSDSKPSPDKYTWTGPPIVGSMNMQSIILNNIKKMDAGEYKCSAHNTMNPSTEGSVAGINYKNVNIVVLYPPLVLPMNDISKQKGTRLNMVCNITAGMPEATLIKWTRDIDNREWNSVILNIGSLQKSDTGKYTCTATNTMKESGDDKSYIGRHNQSFHLDVQYKASITSFTVEGLTTETVTVNENARVRFICNADSNPIAVMTLSYDNKSLKTKISNNLEYTIDKVTCLDAGIYVCYAKNAFNGVVNSVDFVPLFINCHPRAAKNVDVNIKSDTGVAITIVFEVIAYPPPSFKWYQQVNRNWILLKEDTKFSIATSAVQSNLTILGVGVEDFTSYKVIVENLYGQMEQIYSLSPYDIPDPPTNFRYIEGHTTTSSIDIEWEPGYDGGLSQTFYIKYKKSSDLQWNYVQVSDNEKQKMELSLTGLTEGTQYDIVIFASNIKGNSSESQMLVAFTKDVESFTSSGLLIGGIIGGLIGITVLVAIFVIILRRNGYINACFSKLAQKKGQDNGINKSTDETVYNNIGNDSEYEMVDQRNEPFPYSSLEQQRTPSVVDTRDEVKKEIYENMKVQAF